MNFMTRLNHLRVDNDLKQKDLAKQLHIKPNSISKYESGENQPSIQTVIKLAEIFGCTVDYLLGVSNVPNPYSKEQLTDQEAKLVHQYRILSDENKVRVDERTKTLLDLQ